MEDALAGLKGAIPANSDVRQFCLDLELSAENGGSCHWAVQQDARGGHVEDIGRRDAASGYRRLGKRVADGQVLPMSGILEEFRQP
jgi:hypothetical protein